MKDESKYFPTVLLESRISFNGASCTPEDDDPAGDWEWDDNLRGGAVGAIASGAASAGTGLIATQMDSPLVGPADVYGAGLFVVGVITVTGGLVAGAVGLVGGAVDMVVD